jgi:hypothetical protein
MWIAPNVSLAKYNKVLLDRILVRLDDSAEYKAVDPVAMAALVDYFRQSIAKALGTTYPLVDNPGPDVLRVRITLVDIVPNNVAVTGTMTVVAGPILTVMVSEMTGEPKGAAPYMGRTGVAAQFIDSLTGQVIAEYADTQFGQQYVLDTSKGASDLANANVQGTEAGFSTWKYVQQAFDLWAKNLRARLDQAHSG